MFLKTSFDRITVLWADLMGKKSKQKALNRFNKKRSIDAATALWDLAANRRIADAIRLLFDMIGLPVAVALLLRKSAGDKTVDAEAVKKIAASIERMPNRWRRSPQLSSVPKYGASGFHAPH